MTEKKKLGAPRKWNYLGDKKNRTIRLTDGEVKKIKNDFDSLQAFVEKAMILLEKRKLK